MAEKQKPALNRMFVKITDETKRRLVHLSVDADARSVEEFAGKLLAEAVDRRWTSFDPKKSR
jgi:hypothetical protein